jgi:hypothetical protein
MTDHTKHRENRAQTIRQNLRSQKTFGVEVERIVQKEDGSQPGPEEYMALLNHVDRELDGAEAETDPFVSGEQPSKVETTSEELDPEGGKTVVDFDLGPQMEIGTHHYDNPALAIAEASKIGRTAEQAIEDTEFEFSDLATSHAIRNSDPDKGITLEQIQDLDDPVQAGKRHNLPTKVHYYWNYMLAFGPQVLANSQIAATQLNASIDLDNEDTADEAVYNFLVGEEGEPGMFAVQEAVKPALTGFSPKYGESGEIETESLRRGSEYDLWNVTYSGSDVMEEWEENDRHGMPERLIRGLEHSAVDKQNTLDVIQGHVDQYTVILFDMPGPDEEAAQEAVEVTGFYEDGELNQSNETLEDIYGGDAGELVAGPDAEDTVSLQEFVRRVESGEEIQVNFYHEPTDRVYQAEIDPSTLTEEQKNEWIQQQQGTHNSTVHWDYRVKEEGIVESRADPNAGPYNEEVLAIQAYEAENHGTVREAAAEAGITNQNAGSMQTAQPFKQIAEDVEDTVEEWVSDRRVPESLNGLGQSTKDFINGPSPVSKYRNEHGEAGQ